jgi:hypothetical protein
MVVIRFTGYGLRPRVHRATPGEGGYILKCDSTSLVTYDKPDARSYERVNELHEGDILVSSEICGLCFKIKFKLVGMDGFLVPQVFV